MKGCAAGWLCSRHFAAGCAASSAGTLVMQRQVGGHMQLQPFCKLQRQTWMCFTHCFIFLHMFACVYWQVLDTLLHLQQPVLLLAVRTTSNR
jgi:hypothetical protein